MELTVLEQLDTRIPQWDLKHLRSRNCPFCKTYSEPILKRPDLLSVAFCHECGCWYVEELPPDSNVLPLYHSYYQTHRPEDLSDRRMSEMLDSAHEGSDANWQLRTLLSLHTGQDRMRILDVGCGFGQFLLEARTLGADVVGCDLSEEACLFANNKLGIRVYHSELAKCASAIGKVDAVVMRDFVEHPFDPMVHIKTAIDLLNPGGILLVHTPNGGEAGKTVDTAKKWVGFRVDLEHFQYLTPKTVNWLSNNLQLQIERLEVSGYPILRYLNRGLGSERRSTNPLRRIARKIPGGHVVFNLLRELKLAIHGGQPDTRLGTYHLFFILRKIWS